jgi:hypothetical protein
MFICTGGGNGYAASYSYGTSALSTDAPSTTLNFSAIDIGAESSDRLVVVFIAWKGTSSGDISGVTCNTVAMTEATKDYFSTNSDGCAIYYLNVATGTTATIAATFGASVDDARVSVYTLHGLNSFTPQDTGYNTNHSGSNPSTTLTYSPGSTCIVGALWRGATTCALYIDGIAVTEDYESSGLPDGSSSTVGSLIMTSSANEGAVTADIGLTSVKYLVAASWR